MNIGHVLIGLGAVALCMSGAFCLGVYLLTREGEGDYDR